MRSRLAAIGAGFYLLIFACALAYPLFDHRTFAGLAIVIVHCPGSIIFRVNGFWPRSRSIR
jgi:hypothetical protein